VEKLSVDMKGRKRRKELWGSNHVTRHARCLLSRGVLVLRKLREPEGK
jgi:hypothetical protein